MDGEKNNESRNYLIFQEQCKKLFFNYNKQLYYFFYNLNFRRINT